MKSGRAFFLALIRVAEAQVEVDKWREHFRDKGIEYASCLPVITASRLGDPVDVHSHFAYAIQEAIRQNFISASDVPGDFKRAWYKLAGLRLEGETGVVMAPQKAQNGKSSHSTITGGN
ncbi:MAG: hypothetical protein ACHQ6U_09985 [Thermodesulfobacteriota bacterium]